MKPDQIDILRFRVLAVLRERGYRPGDHDLIISEKQRGSESTYQVEFFSFEPDEATRRAVARLLREMEWAVTR